MRCSVHMQQNDALYCRVYVAYSLWLYKAECNKRPEFQQQYIYSCLVFQRSMG